MGRDGSFDKKGQAAKEFAFISSFLILLFDGQKVEQKAQATENYCFHSCRQS
jgi:hypothetical protein